ncbi:MAG: nicotinate-nucleotide adenylyltransferase [Bacillota bacterium]
MKRKYGIMGGTFDPIHVGHLFIAEAARHELELDQVLFIPAGHPPHKGQVTPGEHRYQMTLLATASNPAFQVSRIELDRAGFSYAYDTVRALLSQLEPCELFFIIGADALLEIHSWYRYADLIELCQLATATRPGFGLTDFLSAENFTPRELERIHLLEVPPLAISSSDIRRRRREGRPIRYLVTDAVAAYIDENQLYLE